MVFIFALITDTIDWSLQRIYRATQQGRYESFYREMKVMFGRWEFDPMDLTEPPFPVHIFQGTEDGLVPVTLQRYIASQLRWINYHELPGTGHNLSAVKGLGNEVLKTLLGKSSN
jgi:pimeloyl-ACP methyl ester carboxylesterase